jgi:hypothetical protein
LHVTYAGAAAFASFVGRALLLAPLPIGFGGALEIHRTGTRRAATRIPFHLRAS